jgi:hypothetical protein
LEVSYSTTLFGVVLSLPINMIVLCWKRNNQSSNVERSARRSVGENSGNAECARLPPTAKGRIAVQRLTSHPSAIDFAMQRRFRRTPMQEMFLPGSRCCRARIPTWLV